MNSKTLRSFSWLPRTPLLALALATAACGDDLTGVTSLTSITDSATDSAASETSASDTVDPSDSADTTMGSVSATMGEESSSGPGEESSSGPGEESSSGPGESSGGPGEICGNDAIEGSESCDGIDLADETCISQGFDGGALACLKDCSDFDSSGCFSMSCGNDLIEGAESCDGVDLADETCVSQGFDGGVLACDANCGGFDASGCFSMTCGNDSIDGMETCDGVDLDGQDCLTQGFTGGTLACAADCLSYDVAGCTDFASDCCAAHPTPGCDDAACTAAVCGADAFCCDNEWDAICTDAALANPACAAVCGGGGAVCGDDLAQGVEVCDGTDLVGEDCVSQGFAGGALDCAADCSGFDTSGCTNNASDCCVAHPTPGCNDPGCQAAICGADAFCCNNEWDAICTNAAIASPACAAACAGGGAACGNDLAEGAEVCDGTDLVGESCVSQGFAGGALDCAADCSGFDTSGCGAGFVCQDQDIGSAVGAAVAAGNTAGADNDLNPSCGGGDANDQVLRFVAPAAAQYTFNTNGSGYDTVMSLFSDCATQLACDDDSGVGTQSLLVRNMAAGEVILILVDGFNGATGAWTLNITSP